MKRHRFRSSQPTAIACSAHAECNPTCIAANGKLCTAYDMCLVLFRLKLSCRPLTAVSDLAMPLPWQYTSQHRCCMSMAGILLTSSQLPAYSALLKMLQSLIKNALRASSPALASSLRHVLEGLHSQRLTPGTDAMLLRLYHPLLFRDLAAANAGVRNNALHLLVAAFPLHDSAAPAEVSTCLASCGGQSHASCFLFLLLLLPRFIPMLLPMLFLSACPCAVLASLHLHLSAQQRGRDCCA